MLIAALALAAAVTPALPPQAEDRAFVVYVAAACSPFGIKSDLKPVNETERGYFAAAWDAGRKEIVSGPRYNLATCQAMMKEAKAKVRP